jgi:hypothetical protein
MSNSVDVTYRGANTDTDHYFVIARLRMQIFMGGKKKEKKKKTTGKCQKKCNISKYGCIRRLIAALESTEFSTKYLFS